jgi:hypothetical protein
MIDLQRSGSYKLIETDKDSKVLYLNGTTHIWAVVDGSGAISTMPHKAVRTDYMLSLGRYRLYGVSDESRLSELPHLELEAGANLWQGYLLPAGLPGDDEKRVRIIPTKETITMNRSHNTISATDRQS